jgi:hypothetical protein
VSPEANLIGMFAAILVSGAFIFFLIKRLGTGLTIIAAMPMILFVKGQVTLLLARLDPPDSM